MLNAQPTDPGDFSGNQEMNPADQTEMQGQPDEQASQQASQQAIIDNAKVQLLNMIIQETYED